MTESLESTRPATPFHRTSTAADVLRGVDLHGKRAVVTGASSGIGTVTARALAAAGAEVLVTGRDAAAATGVAESIAASTGNGSVTATTLELTDLRSVRAFVAAWQGPLHILVNNAGLSAPPEAWTAAGWETQLAANHIGHAALTLGLRRRLAAAGGARVVTLSSIAHLNAPLDVDDPHFRRHPYDRALAYGRSKTATALFAVDLTRRWADDGIVANAANPGAILTNLTRYRSAEEIAALAHYDFTTPEQGAATPTLLAASPLVDGIGGGYFEDCGRAAPHRPGTSTGVAGHAADPAAAVRLWDMTVRCLAGGGIEPLWTLG